MGVGIAFPNDYELDNVTIDRIASTKQWPRREQPGFIERSLKNVAKFVYGVIYPQANEWMKTPQTPEQNASSRYNTLVTVELKIGDKFVRIGTYHMPCAFREPKVMTYHTALVTQRIQKLAGLVPYILAGDFNIKPGSPQYKLLTTGKMVCDNPEHPDLDKCDQWTVVSDPMNSAYKRFDGAEPAMTNYAQFGTNEPFVDCLDYIFYNRLTPTMVMGVPDVATFNTPLPTIEQSSDHLPIGVSFRFW